MISHTVHTGAAGGEISSLYVESGGVDVDFGIGGGRRRSMPRLSDVAVDNACEPVIVCEAVIDESAEPSRHCRIV